jgi:hypothetical protein
MKGAPAEKAKLPSRDDEKYRKVSSGPTTRNGLTCGLTAGPSPVWHSPNKSGKPRLFGILRKPYQVLQKEAMENRRLAVGMGTLPIASLILRCN